MSETFTHWVRRNRHRWQVGRLTLRQAGAEVAPLRRSARVQATLTLAAVPAPIADGERPTSAMGTIRLSATRKGDIE